MAPSQQGLRRSEARNFDITLRDWTSSLGGAHNPVVRSALTASLHDVLVGCSVALIGSVGSSLNPQAVC
jgi:hypothetical protein